MKIICFYSDRGGVGRSLLTMNVAKAMKEKFQKRVIIVDTVAGFCSLSEKRKEDLEEYKNFGINSDDIIRMEKVTNFEDFLKLCKQVDKDMDYMFIDVNVVNEINMYFIMKCNYLFIVSDEDFEGSIKTYQSFKNMIGIYPEINLREVKFVFNKVNPNYQEEYLVEDLKSNSLVDDNDFIFPPIYNDVKRFGKINTLSINDTIEFHYLSKSIIELE